jgi:hypothetical protein
MVNGFVWMTFDFSFGIMKDGLTAVLVAAERGYEGVLRILLSHGCDPSVVDDVSGSLRQDESEL